MVGDIDPIKAARSGRELGDELTMHYGLLPRANRGIFAVNELPDLAGRIQVGLFNILQEGDVQIKGYPVRLPLDLLMVFTANPEDYTARGKIITPLKDRIGSEIRTHYPASRAAAMDITEQEAWQERGGLPLHMPAYVREVVEEVAFQARSNSKIDKRSGVSQRLPISVLENVISNAERRALTQGESLVVPRVADVYAAHPRDHRQVRAGVRRRAQGRGRGRPRPDPLGGAERRDRLLPRRRRARRRPLVRRRRLAAARPTRPARSDLVDRTREVEGLHETALQANGNDVTGPAGAGLGRRLRARGAVRAEEDQPQRRLALHRRRERRRPPAAGPRARARGAQESFDDDEQLNMPGKKKYYN